jgi:hypothetical protein
MFADRVTVYMRTALLDCAIGFCGVAAMFG